MASAATALAGPGYLSVTGPVPLRFAPPSAEPPPRVALPPLTRVAPPPVEAVAAPVAPEPQPPVMTEAISPLPEPFFFLGPLHTNAPAAPAVDPLTPMAFLHYFTERPAGQGQDVSLFMPVPFLPPQLVRTSSSKAAYEVTPPAPPVSPAPPPDAPVPPSQP